MAGPLRRRTRLRCISGWPAKFGLDRGEKSCFGIARSRRAIRHTSGACGPPRGLYPDVIVVVEPQPNRAAKDATASIPIVMLAAADPVLVGLVDSLSRPGGNITGITTLVPGGFIAKQMEPLKEMVPHATRIAALVNPDNEIHRRNFPDEVPPAVARLGFQLQVLPVRRADELRPAIESARLNKADALLVVGDPLFHSPPQRLPELVAPAQIAAINLTPDVVRAGGLMSYAADFLEIFRRGTALVDRILRGSKPAELPIEQPVRF